MDVVNSGLKPDRPNARHTQHLSGLFVADNSSIHDTSIGLLNAVAIDGIVEKEREIGEKIQPVILPIRVGKKLAARGGVVVVVQSGGAAERIAAS